MWRVRAEAGPNLRTNAVWCCVVRCGTVLWECLVCGCVLWTGAAVVMGMVCSDECLLCVQDVVFTARERNSRM